MKMRKVERGKVISLGVGGDEGLAVHDHAGIPARERFARLRTDDLLCTRAK